MERTNRRTLIPEELISLVWGPVIVPNLFARWSQGFVFSNDEKTALVQTSGGPCAVIAPVQAFLLKRLVSFYAAPQLKELDAELMDRHLASVLSEILGQSRQTASRTEASASEGMDTEGPYVLAVLDDPLPRPRDSSPVSVLEIEDTVEEIHSREFEIFHSHVRLKNFEGKHELEDYLSANLVKFKYDFGVLLFLYSIILTRDISRVKEDMGETDESMIDRTEGHGGQALINLLICGCASSYVWDGDKDADGLKLSGINRRPSVGFLTRLEDLNYVQVGWYLKNPTSPVWVLASETHLTVLFSWNKNLVTPDSQAERAKQVLSWFDAEGNKFIQKSQFKDVLEKLNLCTDNDYVEFMYKELDPDGIGVILFQNILETFFELDTQYKTPDVFTVYHYNGLESSCPNSKISYAEGCVTLQESPVAYQSHSEITACLSTKWSHIDIQWKTHEPSLN